MDPRPTHGRLKRPDPPYKPWWRSVRRWQVVVALVVALLGLVLAIVVLEAGESPPPSD
jgi:hypothetical protein